MISNFLNGFTKEPFLALLELMSLPPGRLLPALCLLASFVTVCELTRIAFLTEHTRSVLAHLTVILLTFAVQALVLGFVLAYAIVKHPDRAWLNFGLVLGLYVVWYLAGQSTRLVRPRSEGADVGFMSVGALITFGIGAVTALVV
jgi:hypothetical protein